MKDVDVGCVKRSRNARLHLVNYTTFFQEVENTVSLIKLTPYLKQ